MSEGTWSATFAVKLKTANPAVKDFEIYGEKGIHTPVIIENKGPHQVEVTSGTKKITLADLDSATVVVFNGGGTVSLKPGAAGAELRITVGAPVSTKKLA